MWLTTTEGFYSVVQFSENKDILLVRARVRRDLERLPGIDFKRIIRTPEADYPFRIVLSRKKFEAMVLVMLRRVKYPNFKSAVAKQRGKLRAETYTRVWGVLHELHAPQTEEARVNTRRRKNDLWDGTYGR